MRGGGLPGLAPWAILISSWSAFTTNWGVTPKRPEATCLMREEAVSPSFSPFKWGKVGELPSLSTSPRCSHLIGSSPPSPELLLPAHMHRSYHKHSELASTACKEPWKPRQGLPVG